MSPHASDELPSSSLVPSSRAMNASNKPCKLRQSSVPAPLNARRSLGHPSVGGRLTAGAAGRILQGTVVLHSRASVPVGRTVAIDARCWSVCMRRSAYLSLRGFVRPSKLAQ